jgi:splicing factor 3B subunit 2
MDGEATPSLYTVLPEKTVGVGQSSLLSTNRSDTSSGVDIALNPDELDMNNQALEARYRQELKDKELAKEDLSDMISDHLNKQNKVCYNLQKQKQIFFFCFSLETQR